MTQARTLEDQRRPVVSRGPTIAVAGIAWVLLACSLALVLTGVVAGEREASYRELRAAVAAGDVDAVVVWGGMDVPYRGQMQVSVHWRDGLLRHWAPVVEQHPRRRTRTGSGMPVVSSVANDLAAAGRDVTVERRPHADPDYVEVGGWRLPAWVRAVWFGIELGALAVLLVGPQPRRATRWAWFWLMGLLPPLGIVAFLVLGGAVSPQPRDDLGRRLTGGWAFLLTLLVSGAAKAVAVATGLD